MIGFWCFPVNDFVMEMGPCRFSRAAHLGNDFSADDFFPSFRVDFAQMSVQSSIIVPVIDNDSVAIALFPAGENHGSVGR